MSGRGRGLTLPAWMTHGAEEASALEKPENTASVQSAATNGANGQFDSQPVAQQEAAASTATPQGYDAAAAWAQQQQQQQQVQTQAPSSAAQTNGNVQHPYAHQTQGAYAGGYPTATQQPPQMPAQGMYAPPGQAPMGGYMGAGATPPVGYPPYMAAGYPPYGMPMAYPGMPPAVPGHYPPAGAMGQPPFQPPGGYPYPGQAPAAAARPLPGKAAAAATGIQDSNNDASAWSEHVTEKDQRKYWYNKMTQKSTFDKPACLKTPEERSIPPCPWKEYATAEGKKYYSNGTETVWDMPEEYRVWSERVEAASKKRRVAITEPNGAASTSSAGAAKSKQQKKAAREEEAAAEPDIVYATHEEAVTAFRSLLIDRGIPSEMKFKEVQEICQSDRRWNALKSAGERKQNLAEYQTKKAKAEKEEKRERGKKLRDAFLLMLAENTQIDVNTRWRTAQSFLSSDNRYKAIGDDMDREDIFREFIQELDKKEREDANRARREALIVFSSHLQELFDSDKINRRTVWADAKPALASALADVKYSTLSESDMRRALQDFMGVLNHKHREELKEKRTAQREVCDEKEKQFRAMLRRLSTNDDGSSSTAPLLTYLSDWKSVRELIEATVEHKELHDSYEAMNVLNAEYDKTDDIRGSASRARGRSRSQSVMHGSTKRHRSKSVKDAFDAFMLDLDDEYRADKKVFKAAMVDAGIKISHDSKCNQILQTLKSFAAASSTPDPELLDILGKREYIVRLYVEDTIDIRMEDYAEAKKLEDRFVELLEDYYYRSDHVGISWEEAKDDLYKRSAYTNLERSERRRIFDKYMSDLAEKLAAKKRPLVVEAAADADRTRSRSSDSDSSSSSDGSSVGHGKHKKSKKEKKSKKKSSSDQKKQKRSRDECDSPEEGEISTGNRKKASRTK